MYKILYLVLLTLLLASCSTTNISDLSPAERHRYYLDSLFQSAYKSFEAKEYLQAAKTFSLVNQLDSTMIHYQSYPLMANALYSHGKETEGRLVFESALEKAKILRLLFGKSLLDSIRIAQLSYWHIIYPRLDSILLSENGFVPYDELPELKTTLWTHLPKQGTPIVINTNILLRIMINEEGKVIKSTILRSGGFTNDSMVIEELNYCRFTPYKRKGIPSKAELLFPVTTILEKRL